MKANKDKELERFAEKVMKETSLEKPSADFTSKVMFEVLAADTGTAMLYKPLISKRAWFIILSIVVIFMGYLLINVNTQANSWFDKFDLGKTNTDMLNNLAVFKFSTITLYAVVLATLMLFIQLTLLKRYFNKRFNG